METRECMHFYFFGILSLHFVLAFLDAVSSYFICLQTNPPDNNVAAVTRHNMMTEIATGTVRDAVNHFASQREVRATFLSDE